MIQATTNRGFHLQTQETSYIVQVLPSGHLALLYYGKRLTSRSDYMPLYQNYSLSLGSQTEYSQETSHFTLETTCLELSTYGKGDYRMPSLQLEFPHGGRTSSFTYKTHRIYQGKRSIAGLPSTFGKGVALADESPVPVEGTSVVAGESQPARAGIPQSPQVDTQPDVETLEIDLEDPVAKVTLTLRYSVFYQRNCIARQLSITNHGDQPLTIDRVMSMNLDLNHANFEAITLDGQWIRERHLHRRPLSDGTFSIDSTRGVSSSQHNPFLALVSPETNELAGSAYGFSLVYSGSHKCSAEVNAIGFTRVQLGINDFDFSWNLASNETFETPEVIYTYSANGLNGMSQNFHALINHNLIAPQWQCKPRPILLNNWEATYFDFTEKKLLALAKEAKKLGIELFVLDDGWFGKRNDDTSGLGDWQVNTKKLPSGLDGLSKKIKSLGLEFGLWVEPEMVNPDSDLYRAHPEWAIQLPDRDPSLGRNQLVLDLANPAVVDHLIATISKVIETSEVTYIKWDMNRNLSDLYSTVLPANQQKEQAHRYVLGLYRLLDHLKSTFPQVLFESCSSGGNRFDMGMLYYMPQTWTSDNTDANERVKIQYGTSLVYPPSTICAHVSDIPSHQVLRNTPIETRFNVAAFGNLGFELNLLQITPFDKKVIKKQIAFYKEWRELLQFGTFYRLQSPFAGGAGGNGGAGGAGRASGTPDSGNITQWLVVSHDKSQALAGYYQELQRPNGGFEQLKLAGLSPSTLYRVESREQSFNIRAFGNLINEVTPITINPNGVVHGVISNHYEVKTPVEKGECYGDELMYRGFPLAHQFTGTGYNDDTRYIGDFGSRLYLITAIEPETAEAGS